MGIKVFIVESSADYRSLIAHHLTTRWSNAKITEYDPDALGNLPEDFSGQIVISLFWEILSVISRGWSGCAGLWL